MGDIYYKEGIELSHHYMEYKAHQDGDHGVKVEPRYTKASQFVRRYLILDGPGADPLGKWNEIEHPRAGTFDPKTLHKEKLLPDVYDNFFVDYEKMGVIQTQLERALENAAKKEELKGDQLILKSLRQQAMKYLPFEKQKGEFKRDFRKKCFFNIEDFKYLFPDDMDSGGGGKSLFSKSRKAKGTSSPFPRKD